MGERRVAYSEVYPKPTVSIIKEGVINVNLGSSVANSALIVHKIDYKFDESEHKIYLVGFQAINKRIRNNFEVKLNGFSKNELENYSYYWEDPDGTTTLLEKTAQ
ncbi:MAG: hypothetical protein GX361_02515 [Bacteroidales bacterium]|nr:hypothetical protein [Bacteroidales bacterium]